MAWAAANWPPWLAPRPERIQASIASIALSTICVPAGPSRRAHVSWRGRGSARGSSEALGRVAHELGVVGVAELARRLRGREPAQLVDLVVGREGDVDLGSISQ